MGEMARRVHERYQCDMVIWLRPMGSDDEFQLVEVQNIGAGGVLCLLHQSFEVAQVLEIRIELPQREDMVPVKGIIRHVRRENEDDILIGIQFTEVDGMTVPAFMAYIEAMFV